MFLSIVPAPIVSIAASHTTILYSGTSFNLTCDITPSTLVDTIASTIFRWKVNDVIVHSAPDRISASGASLNFSPLAASDAGSYVCDVVISTQSNTIVDGMGQSDVLEIIVEGN